MSTPADMRNADLTFASGDVVGYCADLGTTPPTGFETLTVPPWRCLGWLETSGYMLKINNTTKDVGAAGTLSAIRTVVTGGVKTIDATFLEALNPYVRALFDDVDISVLQPSVSTNITSYVLPEEPANNHYCFCFDAIDGLSQVRIFAVDGMVSTRGNDQPQQADVNAVQMGITFYPGSIGGVRGTMKRYINYGANVMTGYDFAN